ncbi:hypothetical protein [Aneurinibacillus thermoaerophilus]|uniref:hypothetical protein n=1 Tax=Aneurinibacillus thermoaerophilus TaxID=143495 RepID=UPI002E20E461|nr:hypothetical protein [Aneurinibacillus thermoaerophilus]
MGYQEAYITANGEVFDNLCMYARHIEALLASQGENVEVPSVIELRKSIDIDFSGSELTFLSGHRFLYVLGDRASVCRFAYLLSRISVVPEDKMLCIFTEYMPSEKIFQGFQEFYKYKGNKQSRPDFRNEYAVISAFHDDWSSVSPERKCKQCGNDDCIPFALFCKICGSKLVG